MILEEVSIVMTQDREEQEYEELILSQEPDYIILRVDSSDEGFPKFTTVISQDEGVGRRHGAFEFSVYLRGNTVYYGYIDPDAEFEPTLTIKACVGQVLVDGVTLANIGNAIREKNGKMNRYLPSEMATAISELGGDITAIKSLLEEEQEELAEIVLPEGITKLRNSCFMYYEALETIGLPSTLTTLGSSAFSGCYALKNITLPDGLTTMYPRVFEDCSSLPSITIPSGVKTLMEYTFGWCSALSQVTFKGTPDKISENTFWQCTNLTTINVPWAEGAVANAPWGATNATINYNYKG